MRCYCIAILILLLSGCGQQPLHRDTRVLMGTFVEVVSPDARAAKIAFDEIGRVEGLLSKYRPDSEIARLNRAGRLKVSAETYALLKRAKEFCRSSGGALDITVGPLVDIWGFSNKKYRVPAPSEIKEALTAVGFEKIILSDADNSVELAGTGVKIDLGAVAKGYAVDCAAEKIRQAGVKACLINAGGQISCLGDNSGRPWKIAVRRPRSRGASEIIELKDRSAATSGDYEQYFTVGDKRYSHILDPRTGYPADSGVISVTITAPGGFSADALSTAVFVLGRQKGGELVKKYPGASIVSLIISNPSHCEESR